MNFAEQRDGEGEGEGEGRNEKLIRFVSSKFNRETHGEGGERPKAEEEGERMEKEERADMMNGWINGNLVEW